MRVEGGCQKCAVLPGQEELRDREWPGVPEKEEARQSGNGQLRQNEVIARWHLGNLGPVLTFPCPGMSLQVSPGGHPCQNPYSRQGSVEAEVSLESGRL